MNEKIKKPESWVELNFNEIVQKISTNKIKVKQKEYVERGALPVIDQGVDYIGGYTNDISKKVDCKLPVIVFGDHTKIIKFINFDFVPGADGVKIIKPKKCFDPKLFQFFLQVLINKIPDKGYARHFQHLEKTQIPLPPLQEQQQILAKLEELFSKLDNGIENLKKAREQLKTYRQAVLKYAFEGKLTEEWRNRQIQAGNSPEPAEKLLERIKIEREKHYQKQLADWKKECEQATKEGKKKPVKPKKAKDLPPLTKEEIGELPKLPEEWEWKRIFQIGEVQLGRQRSPKNRSNLYPTPYIRAANITEDGLQLNSILEMEFKPDEKKRFSLKKRDLVIAEASGSAEHVGKSALWNEEIKNCCFQNTVIRLRPFLANSKYILYVLKFYYVTGYFSKVAGGVGINHIGANNFSLMRFPLCSDFEQTQIVAEIESRLSVCDKLEQIIENSLQKSEALRQSMLKKAFSGELTKDWREKHPELISGENSAEKLLERIKAEKEKLKTAAKPRRKPARKRRS